MKKLVIFVSLIVFFLLTIKVAYAADFQADYSVGYFVEHHDDTFNTRVRYIVTIKNLVSKNFVKKFTLTFPRSFEVADIRASDDHGPVTPEVTSDPIKTLIELPFSNPTTGKDSVNHFYLDFYQPAVFTAYGAFYDLTIPTIQNKQDSTYKVIVSLPDGVPALSTASSYPSVVSGNQLIWNDVRDDVLTARFGNQAYYHITSVYTVSNTTFSRKDFRVLFPPETANQTLYINSVSPQPSSVELDVKGNHIGVYKLWPFEKKKVTFDAYVALANIPAKALNKKTYGITLPEPNKQYSLDAMSIRPVKKAPDTITSFSTTVKELPNFIHDKKTYTIFIAVKNTGNVFVRRVPVVIGAAGTTLSSSEFEIAVLAPYEEIKVPVRVKADVIKTPKPTKIAVTVAGKQISKSFTILPFTYYVSLALLIAFIVPFAVILTLYFWARHKLLSP